MFQYYWLLVIGIRCKYITNILNNKEKSQVFFCLIVKSAFSTL